MKTKITTALFLLCVTGVYAQHISLSGSLPQLAGKKLTVLCFDHVKGEIPVDSAGKFASDFTLSAGYYELKEARVTVYLEPGMDISLSKTDNQFVFTGKGSVENNAALKVSHLAASYLPMDHGRLTNALNFTEPAKFLAMLDAYKVAAMRIVANTKAPDYFKRAEAERIKYLCLKMRDQYAEKYGIDSVKQQEASAYFLEYSRLSRLGKPDTALLKKYRQTYKLMKQRKFTPADSAMVDITHDLDFNDEFAYRTSDDYRLLLKQLLVKYINALYAKDRSIRGKVIYDEAVNGHVNNAFIKQEMGFEYVLSRFDIKRNADETYQEYIATATNKAYIDEIKALYYGSKSKTGLPSPDFEFADQNGKTVTLSSMRGSFVYIDLWASYCSSCILQMPALNQLEKKYEGKNIRFVSISTDVKKDQDQWKKAIARNNLQGTQLIADGTDSKFHDFFQVFGIPRFILIDPKGIIISENELRPDEPVLDKKIGELLAQN